MIKELIFGKNNLSRKTYQFYLPRFSSEEKHTLSKRIYSLEGKVSLSVSVNTIMILEREIDLQSDNLTKVFLQFSSIILYNINKGMKLYKYEYIDYVSIFNKKNKKFEVFKIEDNLLSCINIENSLKTVYYKGIKEITLNLDFISQLNLFEEENIQFHYQNGVPEDINKDRIYSLIIKKKSANKYKAKYFIFKEQKDISKHNEATGGIDFYRYFPKITQGFSNFMNREEYKNVKKYSKNKEKSLEKDNSNNKNNNNNISTASVTFYKNN